MRNRFLLLALFILPFIYGFAPFPETTGKELRRHDDLLQAIRFRCDSTVGIESSPLAMARAVTAGDPRCAPAALIKSAPRSEFAGAVKYDLPIVMNDRVVHWMDYFQGRGRRHFVRWLSRYERYSPMILKTLREHNLPEDLVFLAMIESGFQPFAHSRARAVGLWQFMRRTGSQYGLRVNWWVDERRDPFKATLAAARHIRDLFDQFGSWYLVAASYNAGAGKVRRAIKRYKTRDFWELAKYRYLKPETKNYVPKLLAAAIIAKNPEAYGFRGIQYQKPLEFDVIDVHEATDLRKVAKVLSLPLKTITNLNPELRRSITPPRTVSPYPLRVPPGQASLLQPKLAKVKANLNGTLITHRVRRGESLWSIARRYGTTTTALRQVNSRKNTRIIKPGQRLMVPTGASRVAAAPKKRSSRQRLASASGSTYRVRRGDSLWSISRKFGTTIAALKQVNSRSRIRVLKPGQRINLPAASTTTRRGTNYGAAAKNDGKAIEYRVRTGDSLWTISRRFNVSVLDLKRWNNGLRGNRIFAGDVINIRKAS